MQNANKVAYAKAYAQDPGNWSGIDGRRDMLLEVCEAYEELFKEVSALKETVHLLKSPANAARLLGAIEDVGPRIITGA